MPTFQIDPTLEVHCESLFARYASNTGTINWEDAEMIVRELGFQMSKEELQKFIYDADENCNEKIEKIPFIQMITELAKPKSAPVLIDEHDEAEESIRFKQALVEILKVAKESYDEEMKQAILKICADHGVSQE